MLVEGNLEKYDANENLPLVYYIKLEYGSFYDLVFEKDVEKLTPYQ